MARRDRPRRGSRRRRARRRSSSTSTGGPDTARGSTSTCGSRARTATRHSGATRSRRRRVRSGSSSRSSGSTTARSRRTSPERSSRGRPVRAARAGRGVLRLELRPGGDALLIAGGSGDRPADGDGAATGRGGSAVPTRLLYSARSWDDSSTATSSNDWRAAASSRSSHSTRSQPAGWAGYARRIDASLLAEVAPTPPAATFVCGPTPFVEAAASALVGLHHPPERIKTERFGPTGG